MSEGTPHEAEILQARERLVRALSRLGALAHGVEDQIEMLVRTREDAMLRLRENEILLESERAITSQRDSLSDSAKAEVEEAQDALRKSNMAIAERDDLISGLNRSIEALEHEVTTRDVKLREAVTRIVEAEDSLTALKDEHERMVLQLELLKEEREKAVKELRDTKTEEDVYALKFTRDERLQLLKTVDTLIDRVDELTQPNGRK
jgi:chromosome segregation ATPase